MKRNKLLTYARNKNNGYKLIKMPPSKNSMLRERKLKTYSILSYKEYINKLADNQADSQVLIWADNQDHNKADSQVLNNNNNKDLI